MYYTFSDPYTLLLSLLHYTVFQVTCNIRNLLEALAIAGVEHALLFVSHMLASYQSSQYLLCCAKSAMGEPGCRKSYNEDCAGELSTRDT